jgi:hypothetical protein
LSVCVPTKRFPFTMEGKVVTARAIKACIGEMEIQLQTSVIFLKTVYNYSYMLINICCAIFIIYYVYYICMYFTVNYSGLSQWPRGLRHGPSAARLHGLRFRILP